MKQPAEANQRVIWRLLDGKPGHENQTLGLCRALECLLSIKRLDITVGSKPSQLLDLLLGRFPAAAELPLPDLIMGAGHVTHLALLAARRRYGGRTLVCMAPSLPRTLFDYCVIPEHDNPLPGRGLFITRGVLNPLGSDGEHMEQRILFLIGGPSCHFDWDGEGLARHIRQLVESSPESEFTLTTSRRTPDNFVEQLGGVSANLAVVPWRETGVGWLGEALSRCGSAWVSEDSVSMVYEALTAGVAVGLLPVPMKGDSRVAAGVAGLISEGVVMSFEQWSAGRRLQQPKGSFNEADRVAAWLSGELSEWAK